MFSPVRCSEDLRSSNSAFDAASAELMELARTPWRQPAASARPSAVAANY
jgi:hypothetical protein